MRQRLLSALLAAQLFSPVAFAQDEQADDEQQVTEGDADATESQGADVVDMPSRPQAAQPGARETAPGQVHTVVRGDTLWDLSQSYLGSPWYWPKVWSYNPEIANPHWIYPGNLVRFFPQGEEVPAQVEVADASDTDTGSDNGVTELPGDSIDTPPDLMSGEEASPIQVTGKIGFTPKPGTRVSHVGFVTKKEIEESGRIDGSFAESEMLSNPDSIYIRFAKNQTPKVGERYLIYKTVNQVDHPATRGHFGYTTKLLGTARVLKLSKTVATAIIENAWDEIRRGDLIGPYGEQIHKVVNQKANDREMRAYVVTTLEPNLTLIGEHHHVVIDKGTADGVQPGNTFNVLRQGDGTQLDLFTPFNGDDDYPIEEIATCMAIEVKEKSTTCLMIRSLREVVPGDRVWMRTGEAGLQQAAR